MRTQNFGIFGKVFLYTLLFLVLTIGVTALVFAQQFKDFYEYLQIQQFSAVFEPLTEGIASEGGTDEIIQMANDFHNKNESFPFSIETEDGIVVYTTTIGNNAKPVVTDTAIALSKEKENAEDNINNSGSIVMGKTTDSKESPVSGTAMVADNMQDNVVITVDDNLLIRTVSVTSDANLYKGFIKKALFILFLLLCASIVGAILFARGITRPIKELARDTRKMACLEEVSLQVSRRDEVGQLSRDVHTMYEKLKDTISELQAEIKKEKEMEESQRYFFSAASHELKTPIAATSALLEGMIAGIGDYSNHPKYLRECLNMMGAQNRIIIEILEIVKLSDERIIPQKEKVELLSVVHSLLPEYNTLADRKEQSITVNVSETAYCHTDRRMICSVLSNLIMNAIQNSPKQEEIRIWCETRDNDTIRLSVLNTNAYIEEEIKTRLFEPFYRVDKARSSSTECGGLGLTIIKKTLDLLGISFALESKNADVIFWIDLPIHE